ncbi:glycine--tRNA ligase [Candidatus Micrarchaeota archaeon]|nr:glycine--tRNA ligase [Candidatus Micrarchaeota archaeon]
MAPETAKHQKPQNPPGKPQGQNKAQAQKGTPDSKVQKIINLCVRRGFVFPSAEIYGSFGGFFDYGPAGAELKANVKQSWWRRFVQNREDMLGLDGAVLTHPRIWKASGHVDAFNDPLVSCQKCKHRFRADHLIEQELKESVDGISESKLNELLKAHKLACPDCKGALTEAKNFNLMFRTSVGATEDNYAYLRPETAQVIFANFKYLQQIGRKALPFGIAQAGRSFRNEISPRNFVFRGREFEQMEIEFFLHPEKLDDCPDFDSMAKHKALFCTESDQKAGKVGHEMTFGAAIEKKVIQTKWHAYWLAEALDWFASLGLTKVRLRQHRSDELSHYAKETWDVEYDYPEWGWKELMGIANRTDFDLLAHAKESGKEMTVFDEPTKQKVVPHVIEPSFGLDRLVFTLLLDAFEEKKEAAKHANEDAKALPVKDGDTKAADANKGPKNANLPAQDEVKTVLHLSPIVAPIKVAVFPLMKKDGLGEKARQVYSELKKTIPQSTYDESGSIGKRYARQDELGTPYCLTVDHQTLEDGTVTLRERDSGEQKRVKTSELGKRLDVS